MKKFFKNKISKFEIITFVVAIFVLIVLAMFIGTENSNTNPEYSVFNYGKKGTSLLYEGLKDMGKPVSISYTMITKNKNIDDIFIVIEPEEKYNDYNKMLEWVSNGGRLILFSSTYPYYDEAGKVKENNITTGDVFSYKIGIGEIYVIQSIYAVNETLVTNRIGGNYVVNKLNEWGKGNIYINEFYHGFSGDYNLWKDFSFQTKVIIVQVAIIILVIIFYLGKRFGNIIPYYEDIERSEDENLLAISRLYLYNNDSTAIILSHYKHFVSKSAQYFRLPVNELELILVDKWKNNNIKNLDILMKTIAEINIINSSDKKFRDKRKTIEIVNNINILYKSF